MKKSGLLSTPNKMKRDRYSRGAKNLIYSNSPSTTSIDQNSPNIFKRPKQKKPKQRNIFLTTQKNKMRQNSIKKQKKSKNQLKGRKYSEPRKYYISRPKPLKSSLKSSKKNSREQSKNIQKRDQRASSQISKPVYSNPFSQLLANSSLNVQKRKIRFAATEVMDPDSPQLTRSTKYIGRRTDSKNNFEYRKSSDLRKEIMKKRSESMIPKSMQRIPDSVDKNLVIKEVDVKDEYSPNGNGRRAMRETKENRIERKKEIKKFIAEKRKYFKKNKTYLYALIELLKHSESKNNSPMIKRRNNVQNSPKFTKREKRIFFGGLGKLRNQSMFSSSKKQNPEKKFKLPYLSPTQHNKVSSYNINVPELSRTILLSLQKKARENTPVSVDFIKKVFFQKKKKN